MINTRFTEQDAIRASDEWGANCGPGAIAAIMGMTLDEVRQHMGDFEQKRYTNPTMMYHALNSIGKEWERIDAKWPRYGLVRIQWEGPWTAPGVPMRVRYRKTHWVAAAHFDTFGVFDINCINNGSGWVSLTDWETTVVPWILKCCVPKADGGWHITHAIEIKQ